MCGRFTQKSAPNQLGLKITSLAEPLHVTPRYNGAPGKEHWVIRQNPKSGERTLDRLFWGLIPSWCKDEDGGRKPINAKAETVASLPSFRDAYRHRRCLVPIDSFFEWKAAKPGMPKQPYAIGMMSGEPFALAGIWENWKRPGTEEWVRTFAIITTNSNELVSAIHDRMPVIIEPEDYTAALPSSFHVPTIPSPRLADSLPSPDKVISNGFPAVSVTFHVPSNWLAAKAIAIILMAAALPTLIGPCSAFPGNVSCDRAGEIAENR